MYAQNTWNGSRNGVKKREVAKISQIARRINIFVAELLCLPFEMIISWLNANFIGNPML
jgi:hypothetical protein